MNKSEVLGRLRDIISNIGLARDFMNDAGFETFPKDQESVLAILRCLSIIAEASRHLPDDIKNRNPAIKWQATAATEDYYYNNNKGTENYEVWEIVKTRLPPLLAVTESELARLSGD